MCSIPEQRHIEKWSFINTFLSILDRFLISLVNISIVAERVLYKCNRAWVYRFHSTAL